MLIGRELFEESR